MRRVDGGVASGLVTVPLSMTDRLLYQESVPPPDKFDFLLSGLALLFNPSRERRH